MSTDFCTIMSNFVATDVYALFNIYVKKFATWSCKNKGGGSRAVYTMCKKTSDLAEDGIPKLHNAHPLNKVHLSSNKSEIQRNPQSCALPWRHFCLLPRTPTSTMQVTCPLSFPNYPPPAKGGLQAQAGEAPCTWDQKKYSGWPSGSRFVDNENTIISVKEFCWIPITADDVPFQTYHSFYQAVSGVFWGNIDNNVTRAKLVISCCKRVHPHPVLGCAL